jgi:hypothetical protein
MTRRVPVLISALTAGRVLAKDLAAETSKPASSRRLPVATRDGFRSMLAADEIGPR